MQFDKGRNTEQLSGGWPDSREQKMEERNGIQHGQTLHKNLTGIRLRLVWTLHTLSHVTQKESIIYSTTRIFFKCGIERHCKATYN